MAKDVYETYDETEPPREGLGSGLVLATTVLLLGAIFVINKAIAEKFNSGIFADKSQPVVVPPPSTPPAK
jgi:hypothetical protein